MYNIGIIAIIDLFMVDDKNTIKNIFMGTNVALSAWLVYSPGGIFGGGGVGGSSGAGNYFCVLFHCCRRELVSGGGWALGYVSTQI